ncbi:MAG: ABC transporter ATP-binding protein [Candidatus Dojkabacteria bacterium]|nr:ABC transporter ATP-binding protein [Candidatus Dojkabacteria bacterium]
MLSVKNLTKSYGTNIAVNSVSFSIDKGSIVGLLGPNGAGKTTTMRIISGYIVPDNGEILINGNVVEDDINLKSYVGYMPENNPLYKDMLVYESLNYVLDLYSIRTNREKRIDFVVNATSIQSVFYKEISELSKGYKQRVGLAQALIGDPLILVLDEPTEGLDPNQRQELRSLIKQISKDKTILISTHVMQEVEALCERVLIINKGKILYDGSVNDLKNISTKQKSYSLIVKGENVIKLLNDRKNDLFIKSYQKITEDKNGNLHLQIIPTQTNELFLNTLFKFLVEHNFTIYEFVEQKQNLEEIFKYLTTT